MNTLFIASEYNKEILWKCADPYFHLRIRKLWSLFMCSHRNTHGYSSQIVNNNFRDIYVVIFSNVIV